MRDESPRKKKVILWIMWITLCITRKSAKIAEKNVEYLSTGILSRKVDNVDNRGRRTHFL